MELKIDNAAVEAMVKEHIHLAVVQAVSSKSDFFVAQIVKAALEKPVCDSYGHPVRPPKTLIEHSTEKMIRECADEAAKEWLETQKPKIKELVRKHLDSKSKGLIANVAERLCASFNDIRVGVWLKGNEDR